MLPEGSISAATRVVLTNAIWFKANWASQFSPENTLDQPFIGRDGLSSNVPFMHQTLTCHMRKPPSWCMKGTFEDEPLCPLKGSSCVFSGANWDAQFA